LEHGTTTNDGGWRVCVTPRMMDVLQAQMDRVEILSFEIGGATPFLSPYLKGGTREQGAGL